MFYYHPPFMELGNDKYKKSNQRKGSGFNAVGKVVHKLKKCGGNKETKINHLKKGLGN